LIPALISIILADESISARFYAACLMNVRKMSYLRISFFLLQALTELNLHLFQSPCPPVPVVQSSSFMYSPLRAFFVDGGFERESVLQPFHLHYPVPWNRLADFISS
jgi:hypothetical protein